MSILTCAGCSRELAYVDPRRRPVRWESLELDPVVLRGEPAPPPRPPLPRMPDCPRCGPLELKPGAVAKAARSGGKVRGYPVLGTTHPG